MSKITKYGKVIVTEDELVITEFTISGDATDLQQEALTWARKKIDDALYVMRYQAKPRLLRWLGLCLLAMPLIDPLEQERVMSEQGDKARKALHDMRWGPYIQSVVERQEKMDDAIRIALQAIAALEAKLSKIVAACESPDNRGRMTQKQQAVFLDRLRSMALAGGEEA